MRAGRRRLLVTVAGSALIAACATPTVTKSKPRLPAPFEIEGRLSLAFDSQRFIGELRWDFTPARETLSLAIAGQSFGEFDRYEGRVYAKLANGLRFEEANWRDLTVRAIGVALPFEAAAFWVQGERAPDDADATPTTRAETFTQFGWTIAILARDTANRPTRMRWQSDRATLTLVVDQWRAR